MLRPAIRLLYTGSLVRILWNHLWVHWPTIDPTKGAIVIPLWAALKGQLASLPQICTLHAPMPSVMHTAMEADWWLGVNTRWTEEQCSQELCARVRLVLGNLSNFRYSEQTGGQYPMMVPVAMIAYLTGLWKGANKINMLWEKANISDEFFIWVQAFDDWIYRTIEP